MDSGREPDSQASRPKKKKGRGITRQANMIISSSQLAKHHIVFDDLGRCIGDNASKFSTSKGVLVRQHCRIGYASWKKLPQDDKDAFWAHLVVWVYIYFSIVNSIYYQFY